jgi:hypothetical protein
MKKYYLRAFGSVSTKLHESLAISEHVKESRRVIFFDFSDFLIENGSVFNYLSINNQRHPLNAKLIYITQQFAKPFGEIPIGWKTIGVIEVYDNIDIVDTMPIIESWYDEKGKKSTFEMGFDTSLEK